MKHVPEKQQDTTKVPSHEEQIQYLLERLVGNQAFGRVRGKLALSTEATMTGMIKHAESPTAFCRQWDQFAADTRIMGSLLAQFERDAWRSAHAQLAKALRCPEFLIEGESIPLQETKPVTIVLVDAKRSIPTLNWINNAGMCLSGLTEDLEHVCDKRWDAIKHPESVRGFLDLYPEITKNLRGHRDMRYSHLQTRISKRPGNVSPATHEVLRKLLREHRAGYAQGLLHNFLFVFPEEQGQALAHFTRAEQKSLASWQCRIAKCLDLQDYAYERGLPVYFHPENTHGIAKRLAPIGTSSGCSHGLGARLFVWSEDRSRYEQAIAQSSPSAKDRLALHARIEF